MRHGEQLEHAGPLFDGLRQLLIEELLSRAGCLPDLGELVPLEVGIAQARGIGDP